MALCWSGGQGQHKQFAQNRVQKIREKSYIKWRHIPSNQNPTDVGSRAGMVSNGKHLWKTGPSWLGNNDIWPQTPEIAESKESKAETKLTH